ncbi:FAS-associated factor 2 [Anthonomus grandis grandis]|uniref:FAS-associated factor 2 n=1 Tax=Anthonomus grandis grandis TaxID=2921223 RepID=UPI00216571D1|nr:FAS-associated factor 2 [Anthonomus grandis grandis]
MDYPNENEGLGLTSEQTEKVLQFQDLTGIEDMTICRDVLQRHQWNLEVAVQEQLNMREGRPSVYASESRPPAVVNDLLGQLVYFSPPTDGSDTGIKKYFRAIFGFMWNMCYGTLITLFQITRRILGIEYRPRTDPLQEVLEFIHSYEEKYGCEHPVFYQGTFSQALNDAKRELRFLAVYLHDVEAVDTEIFCRNTLSNPAVIQYINNNFLFWGCTASSDEGRRALNAMRGARFPFMALLVLKENRMTIVGRLEGYSDPDLLLQRMRTIENEFGMNLIQARADRYEQSLNRSIRQHQDEAFMESLRADQLKEQKKEERRRAEEEERRRIEQEAREEEERRQALHREKLESVNKVPSEPDAAHPDAVHVVFKLPSGVRLERRFLKSHSLEHVFYFVFCHPHSPDSFEITTNFPKRVLKCRPNHEKERVETLEQAGLKNREVLFINDLDA